MFQVAGSSLPQLQRAATSLIAEQTFQYFLALYDVVERNLADVQPASRHKVGWCLFHPLPSNVCVKAVISACGS
jgi:hypothetical protein